MEGKNEWPICLVCSRDRKTPDKAGLYSYLRYNYAIREEEEKGTVSFLEHLKSRMFGC
jgi:hypothetical protein